MPVFQSSAHFAINLLSKEQAHLSDGFAQHIPMEWEKVSTYRHAATDCLLLSDTLGYVICEKEIIYEGGDHAIIIGKVIDLGISSPAAPLVRQKGQYLTTHPLETP